MAQKRNTEWFVTEAKKIHGDRYDYSKAIYQTIRAKVTIVCPEHGEFLKSPDKHLQGQGCPKCNPMGKFQAGLRFIEKAHQVHGDRYDYSNVEYDGAFKNICIICPEHGEFWQRPGHHLEGHGCPECAKLTISSRNAERPSNKDGLAMRERHFLMRAREVHGDRYDYSRLNYVDASVKVCIICPEHGEFWQRPNGHLKGCGCPKCNKLGKWHKASVFPIEAAKIHGGKYDYSKVNYKGSRTKVCIVCPEHGEFWQTPYEHLNGSGCPKCSEFHGGFTIENFLKKAHEIHGDRYDYSKADYKGSRTKVCIVCKEHGPFWQSPAVHLHGAGCPVCNYSHGERAMAALLADRGIDFVPQKIFPGLVGVNGCPLRFDFFIPNRNVCIEVGGPQHYEWIPGMMTEETFHDLQEHDRRKGEFCKEHGFKLIRISTDAIAKFIGL